MKIEELIEAIKAQTRMPQGIYDENSAYDRLKERIERSSNYSNIIRLKRFYKRLAIAASLLLIISIGTALGVLLNQKETEFLVESNISGRVKTVHLSDGSVVKINVGSKLVYPKEFVAHKREVFLVGEAYFDVAKNPDKPFVVRASDLGISVLGTKFNVKAYANDEKISTTLLEGAIRLSVANSNFSKVLTPNQSCTFNQISKELSVKYCENSSQSILWLEGKIVMDNMRLEELCRELERVYNKRFVVLNKALASKTINGEFMYDENLLSFLEVLKISTGLNYSITDDMVMIK